MDSGFGSSADSTPWGSPFYSVFDAVQGRTHSPIVPMPDPHTRRTSAPTKQESCVGANMLQEFRSNGRDMPYDSEKEEKLPWASYNQYLIDTGSDLFGVKDWGATKAIPIPKADSAPRVDTRSIWNAQGHHGHQFNYLRQTSWPVPERTPNVPLPIGVVAPIFAHEPSAENFAKHSGGFVSANAESAGAPTEDANVTWTLEDLQTLLAKPGTTIASMLYNVAMQEAPAKRRYKNRRVTRTEEPPALCRFCKTNGEQEATYMSHILKDASGRVVCPILRTFICYRCGATGDGAHTQKYCPKSTLEERLQSMAMMRSVRLASGRRRQAAALCLSSRSFSGSHSEPLDSAWAALEKKLNK